MYFGKRYDQQFQMSYITRDMDAAVEHARTELGIDVEVSEAPVDLLVYGKKQHMVLKAGIANLGTRQFEILQPVSGPTHIYTDEVDLDSHILNFHHIAVAVPGSYADWEQFLEEVRESGDEFAFLFPVEPDPDAKLCFCYVDTRARIGHYTEYLWVHESLRGMVAAPPNLTD